MTDQTASASSEPVDLAPLRNLEWVHNARDMAQARGTPQELEAAAETLRALGWKEGTDYRSRFNMARFHEHGDAAGRLSIYAATNINYLREKCAVNIPATRSNFVTM